MTPRRWDIAVKGRFFAHLLNGDDPDSERVYRWHLEKRSGHRMKAGIATDLWKVTLDDYVDSAKALLHSMACYGFFPTHAIPIDRDGELLGGAHRVACALALGLETVPVKPNPGQAWAPAWDEAWFVANGMSDEDLERVRGDWTVLRV